MIILKQTTGKNKKLRGLQLFRWLRDSRRAKKPTVLALCMYCIVSIWCVPSWQIFCVTSPGIYRLTASFWWSETGVSLRVSVTGEKSLCVSRSLVSVSRVELLLLVLLAEKKEGKKCGAQATGSYLQDTWVHPVRILLKSHCLLFAFQPRKFSYFRNSKRGW